MQPAEVHSLFFSFHKALAYALRCLLAACRTALKHQWLDRQPELQRMLPGSRRNQG